MLADRWRSALRRPTRSGAGRDGHGGGGQRRRPAGGLGGHGAPADVRWVGAGQVWHFDAVGCPVVRGSDRLRRRRAAGAASAAASPGRAREAWLEGRPAGARRRPRTPRSTSACPGSSTGPTPPSPWRAGRGPGRRPRHGGPGLGRRRRAGALDRLAGARREVAGRFSSTVRAGSPGAAAVGQEPGRLDRRVRPARGERPGDRRPFRSCCPINARTADGLDTSWLWDVPFERLAGRAVVATGDRRLDLAVRLHYAGCARHRGGRPASGRVDRAHRPTAGQQPPATGADRTFLGNYTAFADAPDPAVTPARPQRVLTVAVVYPDLLGTYGDGGNGVVLARRAAWRGIDTELLQADSGRPLPTADLYCIGGGEDGPQVRAAESLLADAGPAPGRGRRAPSCSGSAPASSCSADSFPDAHDRPHDGLGLLDVTTRKGTGRRPSGSCWPRPTPEAPRLPADAACPASPGSRTTAAVTALGRGARPSARWSAGSGNGTGDGTEGAWPSRVLGTYLHGPVLARNAALADLLLGLGAVPARQQPVDARPSGRHATRRRSDASAWPPLDADAAHRGPAARSAAPVTTPRRPGQADGARRAGPAPGRSAGPVGATPPTALGPSLGRPGGRASIHERRQAAASGPCSAGVVPAAACSPRRPPVGSRPRRPGWPRPPRCGPRSDGRPLPRPATAGCRR